MTEAFGVGVRALVDLVGGLDLHHRRAAGGRVAAPAAAVDRSAAVGRSAAVDRSAAAVTLSTIAAAATRDHRRRQQDGKHRYAPLHLDIAHHPSNNLVAWSAHRSVVCVD